MSRIDYIEWVGIMVSMNFRCTVVTVKTSCSIEPPGPSSDFCFKSIFRGVAIDDIFSNGVDSITTLQNYGEATSYSAPCIFQKEIEHEIRVEI